MRLSTKPIRRSRTIFAETLGLGVCRGSQTGDLTEQAGKTPTNFGINEFVLLIR